MFITVNPGNIKIECTTDDNLLCALRRAGICIAAVCGGRGSCGKCKVKLNYFTNPSETEAQLLSPAELANNVRLACKTTVCEGMKISIINNGDGVAAVEYGTNESAVSAHTVVDLGTTTITVATTDRSGNILKAVSETNAQSTFGADVLARIEASKTAGGRLQRIIVDQLLKIAGSKVKELVVAGNTVMLHLLLGEDCTGIGRYPFTPAFLEAREKIIDGVLFRTLPCLHSFIGGDITAGIIAAEPKKKYKLLIDLGTNAEIALFNNEQVYATSAAAGPAFEGAGIRCGCAAIPGAVSKFKIENGVKHVETIGQKPPVGLCGSGLTDAVAALLDSGDIDETGRMADESFTLSGSVCLYPHDVREFQLAKSAVRTGVDLLLKESGVSESEICEVLLAGGFGTFLNVESAVRTGLLPQKLAKKAVPAGNTSLLGAAKYACGSGKLPEKVKVFNLATLDGFNDLFIENMLFD